YKTCKIDLEDLEIIPSKDLRYRNKIRLQISKDGSLSYNKKYSNELVEIKDCLLAKEEISKELSKIEKIVKEIYKTHKDSIEEITIRSDQKNILLNISIKENIEDLK